MVLDNNTRYTEVNWEKLCLIVLDLSSGKTKKNEVFPSLDNFKVVTGGRDQDNYPAFDYFRKRVTFKSLHSFFCCA